MRELERPLGYRRRAVQDLVRLGVAALVICIVGFVLDVPGRVSDWLDARGAGRSEVGFVLGVLILAFLIFGVRRWIELAGSEQESKSMFENAPIGVFRSTPDGRFLMVNPALAHMLGYDSPAQLIAGIDNLGRQLYVHPEQRAELVRALERDGIVRDFQVEVYRRDHKSIWILGNGRAERAASGRILYIEGNVQDITARQETAEAYRQLVDESLQGIAIFQRGQIVFANNAFAEMLGLTTSEIMALSQEQVIALVHNEDRDALFASIRDRLQGKNVPSQFIFQIVPRDGIVRWLEVKASRMEYHGSPAVFLLTFDVTERKRAQDAMQVNVQRTHLREQVSASLARGGTDLRAVLNNLTRVLAGNLGDACVVALISRDGQWSEVVAYAHAQPEITLVLDRLVRDTRVPANHPFFSPLLVQGEPLLLSNVTPETLGAMNLPAYSEYFASRAVNSLLIVPVRNGGEILGALAVTREGGEESVTADDQALLQELADRSALAIANAQLVLRLQEQLEARREADHKYRTLVEQIPAITYIASADQVGQTLYVSPQIQGTLGFTPEEWTATPNFWITRLHPEDHARVVEHDEQSRQARLPFDVEYRLIARDGVVHWIRDQAEMVVDAAEKPLYQHGVMLDITSSKMGGGEEARLQAESAEREQRAFAGALGDAAALLNSASDADQVLDGILDTVARIVPYDTASILLREGEVLKMARARGFEKYQLDEWSANLTFSSDLPKFRQLAGDPTPIVIADTREDPRWVELPETRWIRSHLAVAVRSSSETVGMLGLDSATPNFYTPEHGARLLTFADLAGAAIRNAQLLGETRQRAEQLALLYDAGLTLNRVLEFKSRLPFMFKIAQRALRSDSIAYFRYDPETDAVVYELGAGMDQETTATLEGQVFSAARVESAVGWIARHRVPALIPNVREDPRWEAVEPLPRSALGVPIEHEQELRGVLMALRFTGDPFTRQDERLLVLFANQIAAAMELSRLFQAQSQPSPER